LSKKRVVTTVVTTPWLGKAPVIGGRRWPELPGFRFGKNWSREEEKLEARVSVRDLYGALSVVGG
jgi:hypothetical protein